VSTIAYQQLPHNERHPVTKESVAKIIHGFGRADDLDREQLVRLCRSIARVCDVEIIYRLDPQLSLTSARRLPHDFKVHRSYHYGHLLLAEALWQQLGMGEMFNQIRRSNQLRAPTSGHCLRWWPISSVNRTPSSGPRTGGSPRCIISRAGSSSLSRCTRPWISSESMPRK
jgi:hypothetical protein